AATNADANNNTNANTDTDANTDTATAVNAGNCPGIDGHAKRADGLRQRLRSPNSSAYGSLTASPSPPLFSACPVRAPTGQPPLYRGELFAIERSLRHALDPERL